MRSATELWDVIVRHGGALRTPEGQQMLAESIGTEPEALTQIGLGVAAAEWRAAAPAGEVGDVAFYVTLGIEIGLVLANEAYR